MSEEERAKTVEDYLPPEETEEYMWVGPELHSDTIGKLAGALAKAQSLWLRVKVLIHSLIVNMLA